MASSPFCLRDNPILVKVWSDIYVRNQNFLVAFVGPPGSGKSYSALELAYRMDVSRAGEHRFSIDRVVFTPSAFLELIEKDFPKNTWIVFDEVGVGVNSREWYSRINKLISYTAQTFRFKNLGVCFTLPVLGFLDKQIRLLLHAVVEMDGPLVKKKVSVGSWKWTYYDELSGKQYKPHPRYFEGTKKFVIKKICFRLPPPELVEAYELKKREISKNWYNIYLREMRLLDGKLVEGKEVVPPLRAYQELKENKEILMKAFDLKKEKFSPDILQVLYANENNEPKISLNVANTIAKLLDKDYENGEFPFILPPYKRMFLEKKPFML